LFRRWLRATRTIHFRPDTSHLAFLVGIMALFRAMTVPLTDPDQFWHLRAGEYIVTHDAVPMVDPFSFTMAGGPWTAHEWLYEVVMYLVYRLGGRWGLMALNLLGLGVALGFSVALARLRGGGKFASAAWAAAAAMYMLPFVAFRPQIASYALFTVFLYLLERGRSRPRLWCWLPVLMLVWVNMHASFVMGLGLVALELAWAVRDAAMLKRLAVVFASTLLAALVNPHGIHLAVYSLTQASSHVMRENIVEWASPDFKSIYGIAMALFLFVIVFRVLRSPFSRGQDIALLAVLTYMFLSSVRYAPYLLLWGAAANGFLTPSARQPARVPWWLAGVTAAAVVGLVAVLLPPASLQAGVSQKDFPVEIVDYMATNPPDGHLFNDYGWGGYLIWRLWPQTRVFIDGRADLYMEGDVFEDYLQATRLETDPQAIFARYGVTWVLVRRHSPLAFYLNIAPGWVLVKEDAAGRLYRKAGSP